MHYGMGNNHVWAPPGQVHLGIETLTRRNVDRLLEHVGAPRVRALIILAITTRPRIGVLL